MEELTVLQKLLDDENSDNIILYDEDNNELEFEQVAIIPLNDALYAILKPAVLMEGMADDEALVFLIDEEEEMVSLITDEEIGTAVFREYYKLFDE